MVARWALPSPLEATQTAHFPPALLWGHLSMALKPGPSLLLPLGPNPRRIRDVPSMPAEASEGEAPGLPRDLLDRQRQRRPGLGPQATSRLTMRLPLLLLISPDPPLPQPTIKTRQHSPF